MRGTGSALELRKRGNLSRACLKNVHYRNTPAVVRHSRLGGRWATRLQAQLMSHYIRCSEPSRAITILHWKRYQILVADESPCLLDREVPPAPNRAITLWIRTVRQGAESASLGDCSIYFLPPHRFVTIVFGLHRWQETYKNMFRNS